MTPGLLPVCRVCKGIWRGPKARDQMRLSAQVTLCPWVHSRAKRKIFWIISSFWYYLSLILPLSIRIIDVDWILWHRNKQFTCPQGHSQKLALYLVIHGPVFYFFWYFVLSVIKFYCEERLTFRTFKTSLLRNQFKGRPTLWAGWPKVPRPQVCKP